MNNVYSLEDIHRLFNHCTACPPNFRVLKAQIVYDKNDKIRPLWVQNRDLKGAALENLADCTNARELFNYKPGFKGKKKRTIIIIDE